MGALIATLLVSVPSLGAASGCTNVNGELVVFLDEPNGGKTVIGMEDGELFVNGNSCGIGSTLAILDADGENARVDNVVIDLSSPMRSNGNLVFVSLFLNPDSRGQLDKLTVVGRYTQDFVTLSSGNLNFARATNYPGSTDADRLGLGFERSRVRLEVQLKGGHDTFIMVPTDGKWFPGSVTVRGGSGNDIISGGSGRQRLFGGPGRDNISGGAGNDLVNGGPGTDTMGGGSGNDTLVANDGTVDTVNGGTGTDTCTRCDANDKVKRNVEVR
jgi:Ca2+-binding RTX toxin-like protein